MGSGTGQAGLVRHGSNAEVELFLFGDGAILPRRFVAFDDTFPKGKGPGRGRGPCRGGEVDSGFASTVVTAPSRALHWPPRLRGIPEIWAGPPWVGPHPLTTTANGGLAGASAQISARSALGPGGGQWGCVLGLQPPEARADSI